MSHRGTQVTSVLLGIPDPLSLSSFSITYSMQKRRGKAWEHFIT